MRSAFAVFLAGVITQFISACAIAPGHPRTWIHGFVLNHEGQPVSGATVSMFSSKTVTSTSGCFKLQLSSAYPLTLAISSTTYKSVEVPVKFGFYRVEAALQSESSSNTSSIKWQSSTEETVSHAKCT